MTSRLEKRLATFLACKHRNVQSFTECCLDCGENIYLTAEEIIKSEREKEAKEKPKVVDGQLSYPIWFRTAGGGLVNRDCLDHDHPQQTYNFLKSHGIKPEDYGIQHPLMDIMAKEFDGKTRAELIIEIIALRNELTSMHRMLA